MTEKQEEKIWGFSKIEVITSMNRLSNLKTALSKLGVSGMTVIQAIGCGVQKGTFEYEQEQNPEMELLPKQMIMIVVENEIIENVIETVKRNSTPAISGMEKFLLHLFRM